MVEGDRVFMPLADGVELRDLDFTYLGRRETSRSVNLKIKKGGQRQRIALARALLRRRQLLILHKTKGAYRTES